MRECVWLTAAMMTCCFANMRLKLLASIKLWLPGIAWVFLWRIFNECQESCCFHEVVPDIAHTHMHGPKKGWRALLKIIWGKIASVHITNAMKSRPNPSCAHIYLVTYFEYQKDVLFKLLAVILGIQMIKVLPNGRGLTVYFSMNVCQSAHSLVHFKSA